MSSKSTAFTAFEHAFVRLPVLPIEYWRRAGTDENLATDPLISEALYLASAHLRSSLDTAKPLPPDKTRRQKGALLRYLIRMSSRTTPFGLFASVTLADVGERTSLHVGRTTRFRHKSHVDMEWLLRYVNDLERRPRIRRHLTFYFQSILSRFGNRYYFEHCDASGRLNETSIAVTSGVETLIRKSHQGILYKTLFSEMLAEIPESNPKTMTAFLSKMIDYRIIVSSLTPPLTAAEPLAYVIDRLSSIPGTATIVRRLRAISNAVETYDRLSPGSGEAQARIAVMKAQHSNPLSGGQTPIKVDTAAHFTDTPSVQRSIADDAARLAGLLYKLSPDDPSVSILDDYRQAFVEKYGYHRMVPVLELVQNGVGIGLPAYYHEQPNTVQLPTTGHTAHQVNYDHTLHSLAMRSFREGNLIVQLHDADIAQLENPAYESAALPHSLDFAVRVIAGSEHQVNAGNYSLIDRRASCRERV